MHAFILPTSLTLACLALGGCLAQGNERLTLGGPADSVALDQFRERERPDAPRRPDEPGPRTLDRSGWAASEVRVPVDGTYAFRRYARQRPLTNDTARQRGEPVSITTATDLAGDSLNDQVLETALSPVYAVWEGVLMIPRMVFFASPREEVRHLPSSYWRVPAARLAVPATPPEAPASETAR